MVRTSRFNLSDKLLNSFFLPYFPRKYSFQLCSERKFVRVCVPIIFLSKYLWQFPQIFNFPYANTRKANLPKYVSESRKNRSNATWGLTRLQLGAIVAFRMLISSFRIFNFPYANTRKTIYNFLTSI